jgi:hypothetical protein
LDAKNSSNKILLNMPWGTTAASEKMRRKL